MAHPITRRAGVTAALALAGAALAQRTAGSPLAAAAPPSPFALGYTVGDPGAVTAFAKVDPAVLLIALRPGQLAEWILQAASPFVPRQAVALNGVLRAMNFDRAALLPGALEAFTMQGRTTALPTSVMLAGVRYRPEAFRQAGAPQPSPDWTLTEFQAALARLAWTIRHGTLPGYLAPLPPLVGFRRFTINSPQTSSHTAGGLTVTSGGPVTETWQGNLFNGYVDIWAGFALGFGGSLVRDGAFTLTNAATLRGFQAAVELALAFGAGQRDVPASPAAVQRAATAYPVRFSAAYTGTPPPPGWSWARFPRMPVYPVVPAAPLGIELTGAPNLTPPAAALQAVVRYAQWRYALARRDPGFPGLLPPILLDVRAQAAYWRAALQRGEASAGAGAGAWQDYALVQAGWPATGGTDPADVVRAALTAAVTGKTPLVQALRDAEDTLNRAVVAARRETPIASSASGSGVG